MSVEKNELIYDIYHESLGHEEINLQNQEIINVIGENNFIICVIDLEDGRFRAPHLPEEMREQFGSGQACWEALAEYIRSDRILPSDREEFQQKYSLAGLQDGWRRGGEGPEMVSRWLFQEKYRYIVIEAHFYTGQSGRGYAILTVQDIDRRTRRELKRAQAEAEAARAASQRIAIINSLSGMFGSAYYIDLEQDEFHRVSTLAGAGEIFGEKGPYWQRIQDYAAARIHPDDRAEYLERMNPHSLAAALSQEHPMEVLEFRELPASDAADDALSHTADPVSAAETDAAAHRTASCVWVRATVTLCELREGRPATAVYVTQDVTESKRREEQEQNALREAYEAAEYANAAKSDFLSRMSHDIRTPLNGIIGMTIIAEKNLQDQARLSDCLQKITVAGNHLLALVNEVLDLSKIESGTIDLAETPLSLSQLIQDLQTMTRSEIQNRRHILEVDTAGLSHENVIGDPMRLQQVFMNLLSNAMKYTPDGGRLRLQVREKSAPGYGYGCYEFVFEDNGIGMSREFQRRIFEPFAREEDSRVSRIEGSGLGMTIAQSIVRMMNGSIRVESRPGHGSKFTITVFLRQQASGAGADGAGIDGAGADGAGIDGAGAAGTEEGGAKAAGAGVFGTGAGTAVAGGSACLTEERDVDLSGRRILLAEDNELNREIAEQIIGCMGVQVESVTNGKEALDRFMGKRQGYYDLIFMDVQMPVMNGYDAARAIRALNREDAARIPIIAMTANAFNDDVIASRNAGMNEHISKPLDVERLARCMKYWIGR